MNSAVNKTSHVEFLTTYISANAHSVLKGNTYLVLAGGCKDGRIVQMITTAGVELLPGLFSSHEEADTRMILHAVDLCTNHNRLVVRCDDTDVLVLLLYYVIQGLVDHEVYMEAGHQTKTANRHRFIAVHSIEKALGDTFCSCLPAMHAMTGCDSCSAIYKVGKRTAFTKLTQNIENLKQLSCVGSSKTVDEIVPVAREYMLKLFGKPRMQNGLPCSTLDELRFVLATTTDKPAAQLPPTEDAFRQHLKRVRVQTVIWCNSHEAGPELCSPVSNGWALGNNTLQPVYFEKDPAPLSVRDLTHLYCTDKDCSGNKCQCVAVGLPCISNCSCAEECRRRVVQTTEIGDTDSNDIDMI
jgi:hypothetical protein